LILLNTRAAKNIKGKTRHTMIFINKSRKGNLFTGLK